MRFGISALLPLCLQCFGTVLCYQDNGIPFELRSSIEQGGGSFAFQRLSNSENRERKTLATQPLDLFPLKPEGERNSQKRVSSIPAEQGHVPKHPRPINTRTVYDGYPEEFRADEEHASTLYLSPALSTPTRPQKADLTAYSRPEPSTSPRSTQEQEFASLQRQFENRNGIAWSHLTENRKIRECYSCQLLDWSPPVNDHEQVGLATQFLAIQFQHAISNFPWASELAAMHTSHSILIPFVYKLMRKPLTTEHWARILLVWRNLWHDPDELTRELEANSKRSPDKFLSKFLWISDFISESTLPELFENNDRPVSRNKCKDPFQLSTHESRMIKILSDGRSKLGHLKEIQKNALNSIKSILKEESSYGSQKYNESTNLVHTRYLILERFKSQAQWINQKFPETVLEDIRFKQGGWHFMNDNLWQKTVLKPGTSSRGLCFYLMNYPTSVKGGLDMGQTTHKAN
ncbi:uncharacterized protein PGTG_07617 [Puccinia graminis f. sp. tritici CRL 75-36-700-3]|uniref:Uncharacterized protein n=1 Tax=Puccinia graminis f. sp. tritici (strain CRL 75-36-700-3 / race SCCL) TaxID=418459 RepID=E3KCR8_PUCGT|nr:uncharacterized protein PGTG_07617 [Puccinia graminis f. sp. tritici CRL 75-36-700-3]EFP82220.1 hypothetical protein PGTG_07617 [Puccinia graminis f. sp. tritici CRL 75-36-700-3]